MKKKTKKKNEEGTVCDADPGRRKRGRRTKGEEEKGGQFGKGGGDGRGIESTSIKN